MKKIRRELTSLPFFFTCRRIVGIHMEVNWGQIIRPRALSPFKAHRGEFEPRKSRRTNDASFLLCLKLICFPGPSPSSVNSERHVH